LVKCRRAPSINRKKIRETFAIHSIEKIEICPPKHPHTIPKKVAIGAENGNRFEMALRIIRKNIRRVTSNAVKSHAL